MSVSNLSVSERYEELRKTVLALPSNQFTPQEFVRAVSIRWHSLGLPPRSLKPYLLRQKDNHPGLETLLGQTAYTRIITSAKRASKLSLPAAAAANSIATAELTLGRFLSEFEKGTPNSFSVTGQSQAIASTMTLSTDPPSSSKDGHLEPGHYTPVDPVCRPNEPDHLKSGDPVKAPSAAVQLRARVILAAAAGEVLDSLNGPKGWTTALVSLDRLSQLTRMSNGTCRAGLRDAKDFGWIHEPRTGRKGSAGRYKVAGRMTRSQKEIATVHKEMVERYARRAGAESTAAEILASVSHPAWNYGDTNLGYRVWVVAVADAAGIDPATLAVARRYIGAARKTLTAACLNPKGDTTSFLKGLNGYARSSGCFRAQERAAAAYAHSVQERTLEIARYRQDRQEVYGWVDALIGKNTLIPYMQNPKDFDKWISRSARAFDGKHLDAASLRRFERELIRRVEKRLRNSDTSSAVALWILMGTKIDDAPPEWMVRLAAAKALDEAGASRSSIPSATGDSGVGRIESWMDSFEVALAAASADAETLGEELRLRLLFRGCGEEQAARLAMRPVHRAKAERALDLRGSAMNDIPRVDDEIDQKLAWVERVEEHFSGARIGAAMLAAVRRALAARLLLTGYPEKTAAAVCDRVLAGVTGQSAA
ncbi:hypothetical protein [Arthrobacter sp. H5]|uniref:hypothetical protein n=1 Tax=Arthrobacter sp. H5 TaxID=1267973 RepID=UPI0004AC955F|nr:hypothetical protein [Arthrobacter sp. H5]